MEQSAPLDRPGGGLHVGVIMDGNGRWGTRQGLGRVAGHRAGVEVVRRVVEAAPAIGIGVLTLYAFSSDNWRRPGREVAWLMRLFREYLRRETPRCVANDVRLQVIGRRDRLPAGLVRGIAEAEAATAAGRRLLLRLAIDYSARDAVLRAAQCLRADVVPSRESFGRLLAIVDHGTPVPAVDLIVRTGGERRLSDFLLWDAAYAELVFSDRLWPDFRPEDLAAAVDEFAKRDRRFGGVRHATAEPVEAVPPPAPPPARQPA